MISAESVAVFRANGGLRVGVTDSGGVTAPSLRANDALCERGRGLALVDALSDEWTSVVDPAGTTVWFTFGTHPENGAKEKGAPMSDTWTVNSDSDLLTPAEVAAAFRVDAKTVTRWANRGYLRALRTLGGHRRYQRAEVEALLNRDVKVDGLEEA
jgi:excisionase family DNA binding protein